MNSAERFFVVPLCVVTCFFWVLVGSFFMGGVALAAFSQVVSDISSPEPSLEIMVGAMLMVGFEGTTLAPDAPILKAVAQGKVGNVILFERDSYTKGLRNIFSPEQVKTLVDTLQGAALRPLLVAVDQEGGKVRRLKIKAGFVDLPSARVMGRETLHVVAERGLAVGGELARLGINVNLAPAADLDINPHSPAIGALERSFGSDERMVTRQILAFGLALAESGVIPALKHFPGHGSATTDFHDGFTDITSTWQSRELTPYARAFAAGWPGMVLVGHLFHAQYDPKLSASLSPAMIEGLLRGKLGWQGVVITDDMQMGALTSHHSLKESLALAVLAGNDILIFGNNMHTRNTPDELHALLVELVQEGRIPLQRIRQSWVRIERLKATYNVGR